MIDLTLFLSTKFTYQREILYFIFGYNISGLDNSTENVMTGNVIN